MSVFQSRRFAAGLVVTGLLAGGLTACGGDDKDKKPGEPDQASAPLKVVVTRVAGKLSDSAKADLAKAMAEPLQAYVDGAFLGDDPSSEAFTSFTSGAAKEAAGDAQVLTSESLGDGASVRATALSAYLAVLEFKNKAAGATAKVSFEFDVDGRPVKVTGRLLLTEEKGSWRIFGYDLARSDEGSATTEGDG